MKLEPRGGMKTSLVDVKGRIRLRSGEGTAVAEASACADIPASATQDAPAAPFNNSRRETLVPMIAFTPPGRNASCRPQERGALYTVGSRRARTLLEKE